MSKGVKKVSNGKNLKIIEQLPLTQNTSIAIVEICGREYLVSVSEKNVEIMKELDKEELEIIDTSDKTFNDVFRNVLKRKK